MDGTSSPMNVAYGGITLFRAAAGISGLSGVTVLARGKAASVEVDLVSRNASLDEILRTLSRDHPDWIIYRSSDKPPVFEIWDRASFEEDLQARISQLRSEAAQTTGDL